MGRKKIIQKPDEEQGWLLTYTDCMTLLLCFFILMYALAKESGSKTKVPGRASMNKFGEKAFTGTMDKLTQDVFVDKENSKKVIVPKDAAGRKKQQQDPVQEPDEQSDEKTTKLTLEHVQDRIIHEALEQVVTVKPKNNLSFKLLLPGRILFKPGRADLKQEHLSILNKIRTILSEITFNKLVVEGHTDTRPLLAGSLYRSNWELSTARASRVVSFLSEYIEDNKFMAEGKAFTELMNTKDPFASENRRIELHIYVDRPDDR